MEKRLILALALSFLVAIAWSSFMTKTYHIDNKEVIHNQTDITLAVQPRDLPVQTVPAPETSLEFIAGDRKAIFSETQASLKEIVFQNFKNYKFLLERGFQIDDNSLHFQHISSSSRTISFFHQDKNKKITQKLNFSNSLYSMELELIIQNISSDFLEYQFPLNLGVLNFTAHPELARFQDVIIATQEKNVRLNGRKDITQNAVIFLGLRDRYFCVIIEPQNSVYDAYIKKINQTSTVGLLSPSLKLAPGQTVVQKFLIYLGPLDLQKINANKPSWSAIVNFGTFDFVAQILLQTLNFIFSIVNNWGWSIILFSLLIYLALFPLTMTQMRSMKQMQKLQPYMEELKSKYKDNPRKLNEEMLKLYKEHRVNPLGGCFPLLLQLPIFFSLYQVLMRSTALKGASFLWIKDLSEPDHLPLPLVLPLVGQSINILPILMAIIMFFQQKSTLASANSSSAEQQKMMMIILPLMFGFMFYSMPAGLVLYWLVNSTLMFAYQLNISRAK